MHDEATHQEDVAATGDNAPGHDASAAPDAGRADPLDAAQDGAPDDRQDTGEPAPPRKGESSVPPFDQRLESYAATLRDLKERRAVREITERELLHQLIRINAPRINELPLLENLQQGITDIVTTRGTIDPLHSFVAETLHSGITALNRYTTQGPDGPDADALRLEISNSETMLLKSIQGVVYATGLCMDNFTETLLRAYGEKAIAASDAILREVPLGEEFWRRHFEHYIAGLVRKAYDSIIEDEGFNIAKERSVLVIRYPFDALLSHLCLTPAPEQKSRIQTLFEGEARDFGTRKARKLVQNLLRSLSDKPGFTFADDAIDFISQIVCIDPAAVELDRLQTLLISGGVHPDGSKVTAAEVQFVRDQVLCMACSVGLTLNILRTDFLSALGTLPAGDLAMLRRTLGDFSLPRIGRTLQALLEVQFMSELRSRAGDDLGKMHLRKKRTRRTSVSAVEALFDHGLTRIRRNKLWEQDPQRSEMLLFRPQTSAELESLLTILQAEPLLDREVRRLWVEAPFKVEFGVFISLDLLARSTTNLNQRLAEVLGRFGITRI